MATAKKEKEITLETALMNCRNTLRGVGTLDKNRDAVISLIFIKFCGEKFEKKREELIRVHGKNSPHVNDPSFYVGVFYLPEEARWSYLFKHSSDSDIAVKLNTALRLIEESNASLKGVLQKDLFTSLGASSSKLKSLIDEVAKINEEKYHEEDLIGRVYEYFLQLYAASGTKEDGEFYTPSCIVKLIAELIEPYKGRVYDPCCGSGGMFVQSMKFVDEHSGNRKDVSIFGQESIQTTWQLCKMNLAVRGIQCNLGAKNASTFSDDQHKGKKMDYIMANPPFNLKLNTEPSDFLKDDRWKRYDYTPRLANANYAWIVHMITKLDEEHGIAGFLLANGALGDEDDAEIRQKIIKDDKIEAIIVLPRDMFYTTDISVTLWIINMNKKAGEVHGRKVRDRSGEILFMDLRTWNQNTSKIMIDKKSSKNKIAFNDEQIAKVKEIYNCWQSPNKEGYQDIPELCQSTKIYSKDLAREEKMNGVTSVEDEGYVLMPSRYIKFIDHDLDIDYGKEMSRIQKEMKEIISEEKETQDMLEKAFKGIGYNINES